MNARVPECPPACLLECRALLCPALMNSARDALEQPWILDIDASIKPLYGQYRHVARDAPPHRHTARL